jgi:hypothetical protein
MEIAMPGINAGSRVAHKSTGGMLQSIPEPVDPVGVCHRGTEGVQDELNRDVKLRKR